MHFKDHWSKFVEKLPPSSQEIDEISLGYSKGQSCRLVSFYEHEEEVDPMLLRGIAEQYMLPQIKGNVPSVEDYLQIKCITEIKESMNREMHEK